MTDAELAARVCRLQGIVLDVGTEEAAAAVLATQGGPWTDVALARAAHGWRVRWETLRSRDVIRTR